jgi:hypothetical protein
MVNWADGWAREWVALAKGVAARDFDALARAPRSTRSGNEARQSVGGIFSSTTAHKLQKTYKSSGWTPVYGLQGRPIRKKIIGHGMRSVTPGLDFAKWFRSARRTLALLQKQARQHGGGVFFQPLIQQGADFLADICGVRETRQFKALQGAPRSRKQELPGRLGRAGGHRASVKGCSVY